NPRFTAFLDAQIGKHLELFAEARVDRGFDPRSQPRDARFDQYLLRYQPFETSVLNLQLGKFATALGNWVPRHYSWDNPLITAPLPYENITTASDDNPPASVTAFLGRRDKPQNKDPWVPLVWGPSYTTGASAFGSVNQFDYALEVKNAPL